MSYPDLTRLTREATADRRAVIRAARRDAAAQLMRGRLTTQARTDLAHAHTTVVRPIAAIGTAGALTLTATPAAATPTDAVPDTADTAATADAGAPEQPDAPTDPVPDRPAGPADQPASVTPDVETPAPATSNADTVQTGEQADGEPAVDVAAPDSDSVGEDGAVGPPTTDSAAPAAVGDAAQATPGTDAADSPVTDSTEQPVEPDQQPAEPGDQTPVTVEVVPDVPAGTDTADSIPDEVVAGTADAGLDIDEPSPEEAPSASDAPADGAALPDVAAVLDDTPAPAGPASPDSEATDEPVEPSPAGEVVEVVTDTAVNVVEEATGQPPLDAPAGPIPDVPDLPVPPAPQAPVAPVAPIAPVAPPAPLAPVAPPAHVAPHAPPARPAAPRPPRPAEPPAPPTTLPAPAADLVEELTVPEAEPAGMRLTLERGGLTTSGVTGLSLPTDLLGEWTAADPATPTDPVQWVAAAQAELADGDQTGQQAAPVTAVPTVGHRYEVEVGDSLWSISQRLFGEIVVTDDVIGATVAVLHAANVDGLGANPDHLPAGYVLTIPTGTPG